MQANKVEKVKANLLRVILEGDECHALTLEHFHEHVVDACHHMKFFTKNTCSHFTLLSTMINIIKFTILLEIRQKKKKGINKKRIVINRWENILKI